MRIAEIAEQKGEAPVRAIIFAALMAENPRLGDVFPHLREEQFRQLLQKLDQSTQKKVWENSFPQINLYEGVHQSEK